MRACHIPKILLLVIAEAALTVAEGPQGRQVARADGLQQIPGDGIGGVIFNLVQHQIPGVANHQNLPRAPVVDFKGHSGGGIKKYTEFLRSVHNQQVVGGINGGVGVGVVGGIGVEADVATAPLIELTHGFAQTVHHILTAQRTGECNPLFFNGHVKMPHLLCLLHLGGDGAGVDGLAKNLFLNHKKPPVR